MHEELRAKFFNNVELLPNGCWLWTGAKSKEGYGYLTHQRRICWASLRNPEVHQLVAGTQKDSARLRKQKGRINQGTRNGRARLTEDQVRSIRAEVDELKALGSFSFYSPIARKYGIDRSTVEDIYQRRLWKEIE